MRLDCFIVGQQWFPNNPLLSKADWYKYCIHFRSLNFHFNVVDAVGLKIMALRYDMTCLPNFMKKYQLVKGFLRGGDRQTGG
jgi:hypothetical protein